MKKLIERIVYKYDMLMYKLAYRPMCRICERNAGFGYLIQLQITDWVKDNPALTEEMKEVTEKFYESCKVTEDFI